MVAEDGQMHLDNAIVEVVSVTRNCHYQNYFWRTNLISYCTFKCFDSEEKVIMRFICTTVLITFFEIFQL